MKSLVLSILLLALSATAIAQTPPLVLCYHQIREWKPTDTRSSRVYITTPEHFHQQLQLLHDSGYHTILPDELLRYRLNGAPLPAKPVMITFDDGTAGQYTHALAELDRFGFKAVFFIMTVTLDKPGYLSSEQVRIVSGKGHVIGCHTWDHHKVTAYRPEDWQRQLTIPTARLQQLAGKPVIYFAYPYGIWDTAAITRLRSAGYKAAFQLQGKTDSGHPDYTLERILINGNWRATDLMHAVLHAGR